jgi:hypothetical protein
LVHLGDDDALFGPRSRLPKSRFTLDLAGGLDRWGTLEMLGIFMTAVISQPHDAGGQVSVRFQFSHINRLRAPGWSRSRSI